MRPYPEGVRGAEVELLPDVLGRSGTQSVEDVVVSLLFALSADPRLLQQVVRHEAAHDGVLSTRETHFNILNTKTTLTSYPILKINDVLCMELEISIKYHIVYWLTWRKVNKVGNLESLRSIQEKITGHNVKNIC